MRQRKTRARSAATVAAAIVALSLTTATAARAHPIGPWRSVAWIEQTWMRMMGGTSTYATKTFHCVGRPPSQGGLYRHFLCTDVDNSGQRSVEIFHTVSVSPGFVFQLPAPGGANSPHVFGHGSASGDFAVATASGDIENPRNVWIQVASSRDQLIHVTWTASCIKGSGIGAKSGAFSDYSGMSRTFDWYKISPEALVFPMHTPDSCSFVAAASIGNGGSVTVLLRGYSN